MKIQIQSYTGFLSVVATQGGNPLIIYNDLASPGDLYSAYAIYGSDRVVELNGITGGTPVLVSTLLGDFPNAVYAPGNLSVGPVL
jgi:hypothetical protein